MNKNRIQQIENRIIRIKDLLTKMGPMRPGSLTQQYKHPKEKKGSYWQLSYTRGMRGRSQYVRPEWVAEIRKQIKTYKKFKSLIDEWVDLGIEVSKLRMQLDKKKSAE